MHEREEKNASVEKCMKLLEKKIEENLHNYLGRHVFFKGSVNLKTFVKSTTQYISGKHAITPAHRANVCPVIMHLAATHSLSLFFRSSARQQHQSRLPSD